METDARDVVKLGQTKDFLRTVSNNQEYFFGDIRLKSPRKF